MKRIIPFLLLIFPLFVASCGGGDDASVAPKNDSAARENETLTVSAAVSLKDAFNEIGALYRTRTGRAVNFNFGASGALQKQIETGAPVDVFASAAERQMNELADRRLIDAASRRDFARNALVLIVPAASAATLASFNDLKRPEVRKIAVGNPKTVPAGIYTQQIFDYMGLHGDLQAKLILAEDVRQVLEYVARGEADAGVVYVSDARAAGEKVRVEANAPAEAHEPVRYPIAVVADSRRQTAAREFVELVTSAEGQAILQRYGFAPPSDK